MVSWLLSCVAHGVKKVGKHCCTGCIYSAPGCNWMDRGGQMSVNEYSLNSAFSWEACGLDPRAWSSVPHTMCGMWFTYFLSHSALNVMMVLRYRPRVTTAPCCGRTSLILGLLALGSTWTSHLFWGQFHLVLLNWGISLVSSSQLIKTVNYLNI